MKSFEKNTDEELIKAILHDDHDALGELYNRYYQKVFQKCLSIIKDHDEAFDLAQEAIMKAFEKLKSFRGESSFSTWLYIITHRHCLEALRKKNKCMIMKEDAFPGKSSSLLVVQEEEGDRNDREQIMFSLIEKLPDTEKELLLLKYNKGESIESLQSTFHISSSAVKMRLKRSKEKLNLLYQIAITAGLSEALVQMSY